MSAEKLEPGVIYLGVDRSANDADASVWGRLESGALVITGYRIGPRIEPPENNT